jgi:RNA 2',3'-cyclic 3'-phosphodiesterase
VTRAFVAICPPDAVLDAIAARVASIPHGNARMTARDQWHLTLQFLGDDADIDAVESALVQQPLRADAGRIRLGGLEPLGNPRRARVLALGLQEGARWTADLAACVERRLAPAGRVRTDREHDFVAHVTLGRFREPTDLRRVRRAIGAEPVGPSWSVDEIVLLESRLRPQGAQHVVRARIPVALKK